MKLLLGLALGCCLLGGCVVSQVNHVPQEVGSVPASAPAETVQIDQSRVRLWPIYYSRPIPGEGRERWILWPFFVHRENAEMQFTNLFPVYTHGVKKNPNDTTSSFLFTPVYLKIRNNVPVEGESQAPVYYRMRGIVPFYTEEFVGERALGERKFLFLFRSGKDEIGNYLRLWPLPKLRVGE